MLKILQDTLKYMKGISKNVMAKEELRPYPARFPYPMWDAIESNSQKTGREYMEIIRRGVARELASESESPPMMLMCYHGAPCGEWRDVEECHRDDFELSGQIARMWRAHTSDIILHATGYSMIEAGIPEEAYLHMIQFGDRMPRDGQICAVEATLEDGSVLGTVKRWHWTGKNGIQVRDGTGKELDLPKGTVKVDAVSWWSGGMIALPTS